MRTCVATIYILLTSLCCITFSCQQLPEDDGILSDDAEKSLKVKVRSAGDAEIIYPLYLYAFTENGKLVATQTIADDEGNMALSLSKGDFQVVAISGVSDAYQLPESPELNDVITLTATNGAKTPLMAGRANVEIGNASTASVQITLSHVVAALNVKLKDIPSNVSAVQLALSPLHSTLSMNGEYGGDPQKVKVDCTSIEEGVWTAETTYIFPGSGSKTVLSVCFKTDNGTEVTYGHTFQGVPEANHLFNVTGTFVGGVIVGGNFDVNDWEGSIDVEFEFGTNVAPDDEGNKDDEEEAPGADITDAPEIGSIWNDMIVVDMNASGESSFDLLLMTLDEWEVSTSQVNEVINGYSVNGLSDWRLPTHEEASLLRANFSNEKRLDLNNLIAEYDESVYGLDGDERYLCTKNGIYYSFKFASGSTISKAGEKRSYYVRLVKTYRLNLE